MVRLRRPKGSRLRTGYNPRDFRTTCHYQEVWREPSYRRIAPTGMRAAKDDRPWVRLDQGFPDNPKVLPLSDPAFRLYVKALCWSARNCTDGKLTRGVMLALGPKPRVSELVESGLLDAIGNDYEIHDYLLHQESAEQVAAFRAARRDDGSYGAHVRHHVKKRKPNAGCQHCTAEGLVPDAA